MLTYSLCHDITLILGVEDPTYPGDTGFSRTLGAHGNEANHLVMGTHNGTHLDSPAHFVPGAKRLDDFPPDYFVRPVRVVETWGREWVTADDLAGVSLAAGEGLLLKTANSREGIVTCGQFREDFVAIAPDAAQWCVAHGVPLVGHDYTTVDHYGNREAPAHNLLLTNGIPLLEGANLAAVAPGQYTLLCLPLRIPGAEGAPCRALLVK